MARKGNHQAPSARPRPGAPACANRNVGWEDLALPGSVSGVLEARLGRGKRITEAPSIERAAARWHLLKPLLISPPESEQFRPVLDVEPYRAAAHRSAVRRQRHAIVLLAALAPVLALMSLVAGQPKAGRAALIALLLAGFVLLDYHVVVKRIDALAERARFMLWLKRVGLVPAIGWGGSMLAIGALQWYGERAAGGHEALLRQYGALHSAYVGEPWRLIVGPFLHSGLAHWLANTAAILVAGGIAGPMLGTGAVALFVCASSFGAAMSLLIEAGEPSYVYLGVSAGVLALLAGCAGASLRRPAAFPAGFAVTMLAFALLSCALPWISNPSASNVGHVAGVIFGLGWALCMPPRIWPCARAPG